ncbi:MAG TPA: hypothetical protein VEZ49_08060 [Gemmatimonadales bacterium]|nr:hypothetical protein [Gemmatimonadales bacterium]
MRVALSSVLICAVIATAAPAQVTQLPPHLRDRGRGVRTSVFGTYIEPRQWLVLSAVGFVRDHNLEYNPLDWGYGSQVDLHAKFRSSEGQIFLAYGVNDWLAFELEGSYVSARFERSSLDTSGTPATIKESGFTDLAAQARLRLASEQGRRPEIFASLEFIPATHKGKKLISDRWTDLKGEIGLVRGFQFGTMTLKTTVEWNHGDKHWDLGETSVEYLRQVSPAWRLFLAIEGGEGGAMDEWVFVTAAQWRISNRAFLKLSNGFGVAPKSTDWEPQVGIMLAFP